MCFAGKVPPGHVPNYLYVRPYMSDNRGLLKSEVLPILRSIGFNGSFPNLRRKTQYGNQLVMFQFDKWGSGDFVIEIAVAPLGEYSPWNGKVIPENKLTVPYFNPRFRLGSKSVGTDNWYSLPKDLEKLRKDVASIDDAFALLKDCKWPNQSVNSSP